MCSLNTENKKLYQDRDSMLKIQVNSTRKGIFNLGFQNLKVFGTRLGNIRKRHKFYIFYCNKPPNVKKSIELIIRKSFFDHIMHTKYTCTRSQDIRIYSKGQEG